jgi:uncharacterized protein YndB with AHSA1/START domain
MPDILHRVGINAPIEKVYEAITTQDGISAWWTRKVSAVSEIGAIMELRFKDDSLVMKIAVENLQPPTFVKWRVLAGLPEWVGSCVEFSLKDDDGQTVVLFAHRDWKQAVESCTTAAPNGGTTYSASNSSSRREGARRTRTSAQPAAGDSGGAGAATMTPRAGEYRREAASGGRLRSCAAPDLHGHDSALRRRRNRIDGLHVSSFIGHVRARSALIRPMKTR